MLIGVFVGFSSIRLNAELNPICRLLALLGGATIVVVSRLRVKCRFSEHFVPSSWADHTYPPTNTEQCSDTSEFKLQMLVSHTEENIQHLEHGESLKSRK